ncbi:MAG TPA: type II toxin-antitoxin system HicB family antitoxin [Thermoanaerobaculia bacterium]|nr:type II toxin-antitoxin system HicB family antitoxin [Thermoanaerobaculia bacterium]
MLLDYLDAAMEQASYEKIEGDQPYYGEIQGFPGLWAAGSTLEECRRNLRGALEDWVFFSVARGMELPPAGELVLELPRKLA